MGEHDGVTPHLALPRLRDRHPLPKGEGCASDSSRLGKGKRNKVMGTATPLPT
jgi:hypothetical protein